MKNKNKAFLTSAFINVILLIIVFTLFNYNFIENNTKNMIIVGVFIIIFEIIKIKIIEKYYNL
jgi:membrane-bound ClpP family serine protease